MDDAGDIKVLPACPKWLKFKESSEGTIRFYTNIGNVRVFITDVEQFKDLQKQLGKK